MGIFPRITLPVIQESFDEMSRTPHEAVRLFCLEQPFLAAVMEKLCATREEYFMRMSAMQVIYIALEKQMKIGQV